MTCDDVQRLLHAFVDTELPPPMLLAVARHAGSCAACDGAIGELTEFREALTRSLDRAVDDLDLSGVWREVASRIDPPASGIRRVRRLGPLSTFVPLAIAAGLAVAFGIGRLQSGPQPAPLPPVARNQLASRATRPNHAVFDRLLGQGIDVRREPKSGMTVVLVNHMEGTGE